MSRIVNGVMNIFDRIFEGALVLLTLAFFFICAVIVWLVFWAIGYFIFGDGYVGATFGFVVTVGVGYTLWKLGKYF